MRKIISPNGTSKTKGLTQAYLSGNMQIPVPAVRREGTGKWLRLLGAETNNLKNIDIKIPYGTLTCVTGVSGCGKSSLIEGTLRPALEERKSIQKRECIIQTLHLVLQNTIRFKE